MFPLKGAVAAGGLLVYVGLRPLRLRLRPFSPLKVSGLGAGMRLTSISLVGPFFVRRLHRRPLPLKGAVAAGGASRLRRPSGPLRSRRRYVYVAPLGRYITACSTI